MYLYLIVVKNKGEKNNMETLIYILNYQPFGDYGPNHILGIRVIHFILIYLTYKICPTWKEFKATFMD